MSEEDTQRRAESEARGAELRENVALTDARRAEEQVARAQEEKEKAAAKEEKLSHTEQQLRERAERVHAEADRMRAQAAASPSAGTTVSGVSVTSPGFGSATEPDVAAAAAPRGMAGFPGADRLPESAQRPEVLIGAAFAGAFITARILKRIFD
jgi:FKBP-type peptidyl-prolyl cis-trans isomerase